MARLSNAYIAEQFEIIADLLQIKGESVFRYNSYRNGAEAIRNLPQEISTLVDEQSDLTTIPNIGKAIAQKIEELVQTGKLGYLTKLTAEVPLSLRDILHINGVGPKKAKLFWEELNITTIEELEAAAVDGRLQELSGMGKKSEQKILDSIEALARRTDRISIGVALPLAEIILEDLLQLPEALKGDIAGSLRRKRETIGDIDILIAAHNPEPIMEAFVNRIDIERVLGRGPTKSSVELVNGPQVDVRVLEPARYGTALSYFTGSQAHNIRLRELALKKGLSLNEHSFSYVDGSAEDILCATEEEVYNVLGLAWVPPELREDRGEVEAALKRELPTLVTVQDMRGDFHMHTTYSDGKFSIREMAEAAKARGRTHIVITDHSRSLGIANGLSIERLLAQQEEVRQVDAEMGDDFRVLHGTEMDIKADGTLDFPDEVLAQLDVVIASLHVSLRQPREQITERMLNAIKNPHVDIIGHPRARHIPDREPADLDMEAVLQAAKEHDVALEINANPLRLDLDDIYARRAQEMGIKLTINTDAHRIDHMDLLHYGVNYARRAWIRPENVINTWSLDQLLAWVQARGQK